MKKASPHAAPAAPKAVRCAIYTRKSTEEGLNQEFNSLDAQREAAEAFIKSQAAEGWQAMPERYDDGGFSGGNMERPALQRLLGDVKNGKADAIIVYKVDRLSRSLLDFSRIMELLDENKCSFISVTQAFNTTHSMGRLTLNILLSFAQFEREIISERVRDKMCAARKKGKFIGGALILGYDLDDKRKRLVLNPEEAERVRAVFSLFIEKGSVRAAVEELNRRGLKRKSWTGKHGQSCGGGPWTLANLPGFLQNLAYVGKLEYKGEILPAEHPPILDEETWAKAKAALASRSVDKMTGGRKHQSSLLGSLLCCGSCGSKMQHSHTTRKAAGRRYRYYVCARAAKLGHATCETRCLPAPEIERFVVERIRTIGKDASLAGEVARRARSDFHQRIADLKAERERMQRDMGRLKRLGDEAAREPSAAKQRGELEEQMRETQGRVTAITEELAAPSGVITDGDVAKAVHQFDAIWDNLDQPERTRLLALLVEQVIYDRVKSSVTITFRPNGIRGLANPPEGKL